MEQKGILTGAGEDVGQGKSENQLQTPILDQSPNIKL